jgi:hypothetical protein
VTVTDHRGRASWRFEHFSPRQWRLSQPSTPLPPIPTHQVRRQAFAVQCREFLDELHYQELRALQGMRGSRRDEVQAIRDLERHVRSVMENMQTGRTEVFRDRATAGWRQTPTAWQALDSVADALLHLHPDCFIGELWGTSEEPDHWYMYIDPDDGSHYEFWIRRGVLYGPVEGPSTSPPLRDPRKVFSARERGWWSFTDSDVAVSRANQAGGFAYLKRGGRIGLLQMRYERDHLVWVVPYERFSRAYSYRLRVFVDMASGEVVSTQKDRFLNLP